VASVLGGRLDSGLLRWLADETAREASKETTTVFTRPQFYSLAFRERDSLPSPAGVPDLPVVARLPNLHWGVLRSDKQAFRSGMVVGVKGRDGDTTHHAQADLGGFTLDAGGEMLLIDPGYYQGDAEDHSLPLIDGAGPNRRGRAHIVAAREQGAWRMMTVDATDAYQETAQRMRRILVMHGEQAVIVLDDILPKGKGAVTHQLQCGAPAVVDSEDAAQATVSGKHTQLAVQVAGPPLSLAVAGPIDFERSWVYANNETPWYRLTGDYTASGKRPLVTVLMPHGKGKSAPRARCEFTAGECQVKLPSGERAVFRQSETGWQWAPSGG